MQFTEYSIKEINEMYDICIDDTMTLESFTEHLEQNEIRYFYASNDPNDIKEVVDNNKFLAGQLQLKYISIPKINSFIAIH